MAEGLHFSDQGLLLLMTDYPIRQLVPHEKDFDWMAFWEFNPEVF
jgi:hypothetical protein